MQDLESERDARIRETSDLRAAVQSISEVLTKFCGSSTCDYGRTIQEMEGSMAKQRESLERRLCEFTSRVQALAPQTSSSGMEQALSLVQTQLADLRRETSLIGGRLPQQTAQPRCHEVDVVASHCNHHVLVPMQKHVHGTLR